MDYDCKQDLREDMKFARKQIKDILNKYGFYISSGATICHEQKKPVFVKTELVINTTTEQ